jgi:hypothetical protein
MGEVVGRWWNGRWGRLARRDVWLRRAEAWRVEAREGDSDSGRTQRWTFDDEATAREFVQKLLAAGDGWKDLTDISTGSTAMSVRHSGPGGQQSQDHPS